MYISRVGEGLSAFSLLPSVVLCFFIVTISAHPSLSPSKPLPVNQKLSRRAVSSPLCNIWPGGVVPYCFEEGTHELYRDVFKKGVAKWTDKRIPVMFVDTGDCPAADANNRWQTKDLLVVNINDEATNAAEPFSATFGYTGETDQEDEEVEEVWQRLEMPQAGGAYCFHREKGSNELDPSCLQKWTIPIARALGQVLCLSLEHRRATDKDLIFDFRGLEAYSTADEEIQKLIRAAESDPESAIKLSDEYQINGPWYYSRYPQWDIPMWESSDFDWHSIMLVNGSQYAEPGRRVMFHTNGRTVKTEDITEPSDNDVNLVRWLYREYAEEYSTPPYDSPPTYDADTPPSHDPSTYEDIPPPYHHPSISEDAPPSYDDPPAYEDNPRSHDSPPTYEAATS